MKFNQLIFTVIFLSALLFSFNKKESNQLIGVWKLNTFIINKDTIYNHKNPESAVNYFKNIMYRIDSTQKLTSEQDQKIISKLESFKQVRLEITENNIFYYKLQSNGEKSESHKSKYKIVSNNLIEIKEEGKKKKTELQYRFEDAKLVLKQIGTKSFTINVYERIK